MIHNSKNLSEYNLFINSENKILQKAILVDNTTVNIYFKNYIDINKIEIFYYNYQNNFELVKYNYSEIYQQNNLIILTGNFGFDKNYVVKFYEEQTNVILNPEPGGILDTFFYVDFNQSLGLIFKSDKIIFKLWSPPAVKVEIIFFNSEQKQIFLNKVFEAQNLGKGIWTAEILNDEIGFLENKTIFYQYKIYAYGKILFGLDPYAKSMALFNPEKDTVGKSALINCGLPEVSPPDFVRKYKNSDFLTHPNDAIFYEVHIRDFTVEPGEVAPEIAGTYTGFLQKTDYLQQLGITHVQILPVNKCYTQTDDNKDFTDKNSKKSNYNWGYDPLNFFTPEGRYSCLPQNPVARILELKSLIQNLHSKNIGVVLDVVFNHVYAAEIFENIAPGCYFRHKNNGEISGHTGAGPGLETRHQIVRKLIIDVLLYFIEEFHADGFRFDLMSFIDIETMKIIREKAGRKYNEQNIYDLILQGEAWNFTDLESQTAYTKTNLPDNNLLIALFNDTFRDSLAGNGDYKGFIQGNTSEISRLASGIVGANKFFDREFLPFCSDIFFNKYNLFARNTSECLNYFSIHDGLTIWDKINITAENSDEEQKFKLIKLAFGILLTSQGKIILHAGDEIMRSKPLADFDTESKRAKTSPSAFAEFGTNYFHENSYQSPDFTNMFRWSKLKGKSEQKAKSLFNYVKGLIEFRRHFQISENIESENIDFLENENSETKNSNFHTFNNKNLKSLTINFKNGPSQTRYYIAGEVHKGNPNPTENKYFLDFDQNGKAKINFLENEIKNFDINKWSNTPELNIKLVKTPGLWDFIDYAYTPDGNNLLYAEEINQKSELFVDLSVKNYGNKTEKKYKNQNILAFLLKCKFPEYKFFAVFINSGLNSENFYNKIFDNSVNFVLFADSEQAGKKPININKSEIKIHSGYITLKPKSLTVVAKKADCC